MKLALSRTQWMASAAVSVFLAALGGTAAVQAQSRDRDLPPPPAIEWDKRRLERLERNVRRLEAQLNRANRDPNAIPTIIEPDAETVALQLACAFAVGAIAAALPAHRAARVRIVDGLRAIG